MKPPEKQEFVPRGVSLDIVVIGLNEARNLDRCFQSIRSAVDFARPQLETVSVIYVDSGSSDGSVDVARNYCDIVVRLTSAPSAAAARTAGFDVTSADFIQFLDGDMVLAREWFVVALTELAERSDPDIAGLMGVRDDVYVSLGDGNVVARKPNFYGLVRARVAPRFGGGVLLLRRALEECGAYNPALKRGEEPDLYARFISKGYRVFEIPVPFITHYTPEPEAPSRLKNTFRYEGTAHCFGRALLSAVENGYALGLFRVYRWTALVWLVDILTVVLLLASFYSSAITLQLATLGGLAARGKPREYALARTRLTGFARATWERLTHRLRTGGEVAATVVHYERL